uniref:SNTX MACPF/CDC-like domain-containing protein n=2 Tax=Acrobeloides nanus TaxID=290746 RepID=A0A914DTV3_9BILA
MKRLFDVDNDTHVSMLCELNEPFSTFYESFMSKGLLLNTTNQQWKSIDAGLVFNFTTKNEQFMNISDIGVYEEFHEKAILKCSEATHVIVGIQYGVTLIVKASCNLQIMDEPEEGRRAIKTCLAILKWLNKMPTRQALGRSINIGGLYDAVNEKVCEGNIIHKSHSVIMEDAHDVTVEAIYSLMSNELFQSLKIEDELKLSLLSGILQVDKLKHPWKELLSYDADDSLDASAILAVTFKTQKEVLTNLNQEQKAISLSNIKSSKQLPTHIVTKITYGAVVFARFSETVDNINEMSNAQARIKVFIENLKHRIKKNFPSRNSVATTPGQPTTPGEYEKETKFLITLKTFGSTHGLALNTKPVADITENISENIDLMRQNLEKIVNGEIVNELEEIVIEVCPLKNGRTVCRSPKCTQKAIIEKTNLKLILRESLYIEDGNDKEQKQKENIRNSCVKIINQYEQEVKRILEIFVQFSIFLKKNSIIAYNDAFEEQIKTAIKTEGHERERNNIKLEKLENFLKKYQEDQQELEKNLEQIDSGAKIPTAEDIVNYKEELFKMKCRGKDIKNLYINTIQGRQMHLNYSETIHKIDTNLVDDVLGSNTTSELQINMLENLFNYMTYEVPKSVRIEKEKNHLCQLEVKNNMLETSMLEPLSGTITRQALGRFAKLGDLYDARTDHFCGRNLFLNNINRESIHVHKNDHVKIDIICDERKSRKMDKLNIEGELQISILGELIPPPSGHAKYLSDKEIKEKEYSSTLIYKRYTQTEQVNIDHKSNEFNIDVVKAEPSATHVVIGIEYGAIATMTLSVVYDRKEDANKRSTQIQLELEKMMMKLGKKSSPTNYTRNSFRHRQTSTIEQIDRRAL